MRDALPVRGRDSGGADVHSAVELHGIAIDHLTADGVGQRDTQSRLAGSGGTDNGHHGWRRSRTHARSDGMPSETPVPTLATGLAPTPQLSGITRAGRTMATSASATR